MLKRDMLGTCGIFFYVEIVGLLHNSNVRKFQLLFNFTFPSTSRIDYIQFFVGESVK